MILISARFIVFKSVVKLKKHEFRQLILNQENKAIKQIRISKYDIYKNVNGIEWKENNKEVVIKNTYHEVVSITNEGDDFIINVIEDKEENNLFKNYFDNSESGKKLADNLLVVFAFTIVLPSEQIIISPPTKKVHQFACLEKKLIKGFCNKKMKPPRF